MPEDRLENPWDQNQPSTWQWLLIGGIAFIALCGMVVFAALGFRTYSHWRQDQQQISTQENSREAAADIVRPTTVVIKPKPVIDQAKGWPILIQDPFDSNQHEWMEGEIDDEYTTMTLSIAGEYLWDATAKQGFVWRIWPESDLVRDFYLAVDVQNRSANEDAQYGLIFRNNDQAYFYLEVRDSGYYRLMLFDGQVWQDLISSTYTALIRRGEFNRLAVASVDDVYYVLINGSYVGEAQAISPLEGQAGVAIGLSSEGERGIIAFDNFELRARGVLE